MTLNGEETFEIIKESSRYRHSGVPGDGKEEEAANDSRAVMGHDEPISEQTPKQNPVALPSSKSPVQSSSVLPKSKPLSVNVSAGPVISRRLAPKLRPADLPFNSPVQRSLVPPEFRLLSVDVSAGSGSFTGPIAGPSHQRQADVSEHSRTLEARNDTAVAHWQSVANSTVEVSEGFDMFDQAREPERNSQQADYLRILRDKFGTTRPNGSHRYSFIDDTSLNNGGCGYVLEKFIDPDNESYDGRHSLKSVSTSLQSMLATQASD